MKIKYVLALALVAMLAIPGSASQFGGRFPGEATAASPLGTAGLFSDPHATPALSIQLPTRFTALTVDAGTLERFRG